MSTQLSLARLVTRDRLRVYPTVVVIAVLGFTVWDIWAHGLQGKLGGDFLSFYTGGYFVSHGHPEALAHGDLQHAFQQQVRRSDGTSMWVSPPFFAWLFAPLAALPFLTAYVVFMLISMVLCSTAFAALGRDLGSTRSLGRTWWLAAQFYPTLHWLIIGQTTGLWLGVLVWVFLLLRRGRDVPAGFLFGLLACKPTLALGLAVGLLAARRFRALLCAAASGALLVGIGFLTVPGAMLRYLHAGPKLVSFVRDSGYPTQGLFGSFEFGTLLFDGVSPCLGAATGVLLTLSLLALIAGFWARTPWRPGSARWDLRMAATLALGVVASPHLFGYDLMLLLLPFFIVLARTSVSAARPFGEARVLEATVWVWLLALATPLLAPMQHWASLRWFGVPMTLQAGVIAIVIWGVFVARWAARVEGVQVPSTGTASVHGQAPC